MSVDHKLNIIEIQAKLSTLWIFIFINMLIRDLHEFARPRYLQQLIDGVSITEELLLVAGIVLEIPMLMVILSRVLKDNLNRWANIIVAPLFILATIGANTNPDLDDIFFAAVEILALLAIVWSARKWPQQKNEIAGQREG